MEKLFRIHEDLNKKIIEKHSLLKKFKSELDDFKLDIIDHKLSKNLINETLNIDEIENNKKKIKKQIVLIENNLISFKNDIKFQNINKEIKTKKETDRIIYDEKKSK